MENAILKDKIEIVASRMTSIKPDDFKEECLISNIDYNKWEWPQGVGIYGMYRYWQFSGNDKYLDLIVDWYNQRIKDGLPEKNVNTCAPMLTLTFIYEHLKEEKYLKLITEWAQWVFDEMPRTQDGGLQHITSDDENYGQLWVDTLFMTNLFLVRAGVILGKQEYIEESKKQLLVHIKYLFDKQSGLWFHGWSFPRNDNFSAVRWARANCWYTAGVVDYIDMVSVEPFLKEYLIDTLLSQVKSLKKYQCEDGMWRTIIDDESSYKETSATAGFAYGILKAVRKGYISEEYKEIGIKGLQAVIDRIREDGTVEQVSYGTPVFENAEDYKKVPYCPITYGQALAILCMTESSQ